MAQLNALLKIRADVQGKGGIDALASSLGGLKRTSDGVSKGLGGMAQAAGMGGLAGAFTRLIPLFSAAGIAGMAQQTIQAGDAFWDMSQRTGVSVEMLAKFKKAAALSGTSIEAVEKGLLRLSRNMVAAASSSRVGEKTKEDMDKAVAAVRDGERRQVEAVKDAANQRVQALEAESDRRLRELNKRYRNEQQKLDDNFSDQEESQRRAIDRRYDKLKDAIQDDQSLSDDAKRDAINRLSDQQAEETKALQRGLRDRRQARQDALDEQRLKEEDAIRGSTKAQVDGIKSTTDASVRAIKSAADAQEKALKGSSAASELSEQMAEMGLSGKEAAKMFYELGVRVTDTTGKLRNPADVMLDLADAITKIPEEGRRADAAMKLMGRGGAELIPMFLMGSKAIRELAVTMTTGFARAADQYSEQLVNVGGQVAKLGVQLAVTLLPVLMKVTDIVLAAVKGFNALPQPLQYTIIAVAGLTLALGFLVPLIANVAMAFKFLAALKIGATIAGWLGAVGPAIAGIQAALAGLMAWLTGTLLPGLLAFFSGPVGWTVLAVAAVVAMALLFREPIIKFFSWLGDSFRRAFDQLGPILSNAVQGLRRFIDPIGKFFSDAFGKLGQIARAAMEFVGGVIRWGMQAAYAILWQIFVQPYINLWNVLLKQPVTMFWEWLKGVVTGASTAISQAFQTYIAQPFANLWNTTLRGPVSGMMQWLRNTWTGFVNFFQNNIIAPITGAWKAMTDFLPNAMRKVQEFVTNIWNGIINTIRSAVRVVLQGIANNINAVTGAINFLIRAFNRLPGPDIPIIPQVQIPAFAEGGIVRRPTLAMVGEGGEPEYIIPASKMPAASARFMAGQRGEAVLSGGGAGGGTPQINITTGPVLQQDGQRYVTIDDLERAMRVTAESVMGRLRTPSARIALGLR